MSPVARLPDDGRLTVRAASFTARSPADVALVDFDRMLAADGIALGVDHSGAQLVQDLERRLVSRESELPLTLDGVVNEPDGHASNKEIP